MGLEHGHRIGTDTTGLKPRTFGRPTHEVFGEFRHILAPVGQVGHFERHDVEPVVEVLTKLAGRDLGLQITGGRCDDAHIDANLGTTADPFECLVLQRTHDLALGFHRHIADLVEQKRTVVRLLEQAEFAALVSLRAASLNTEELDLHPFRLHRRTVDDDEGLV